MWSKYTWKLSDFQFNAQILNAASNDSRRQGSKIRRIQEILLFHKSQNFMLNVPDFVIDIGIAVIPNARIIIK